ncbi:MAG: hypothetical protein WCF94_03610 [bacterium]
MNYIIWFTLVCVAVYIFFGVILFNYQNILIYKPNKTDFTTCPLFSEFEKVTYGETRAYLTKKSSDRIVVFYHGNDVSACDEFEINKVFLDQGYSTLFVEYAGYAGDRKNPTMEKILKNVEDTIEYLKTNDYKNVTVVAESLGTGPAAYHAHLGKISNLILITAYDNFQNVVSYHYPIFPISFLLKNNFTPDKWLVSYGGKASIILADNDEDVPKKIGQKLFETIPSKIKKSM